MKKALANSAAAAGLLLASQATLAEDQNYVGLQYNIFSYSEQDLEELEPEGATFIIGGDLNDYFRIDARIGQGVSYDSVPGLTMMIDNYIGFYLKGGISIQDVIFPYIAAGYSIVDLKADDADYYETESDASYGVGVDIRVRRFQLGIEYLMLQDKTAYELDTFNITGSYLF